MKNKTLLKSKYAYLFDHQASNNEQMFSVSIADRKPYGFPTFNFLDKHLQKSILCLNIPYYSETRNFIHFYKLINGKKM